MRTAGLVHRVARLPCMGSRRQMPPLPRRPSRADRIRLRFPYTVRRTNQHRRDTHRFHVVHPAAQSRALHHAHGSPRTIHRSARVLQTRKYGSRVKRRKLLDGPCPRRNRNAPSKRASITIGGRPLPCPFPYVQGAF
ncbi:hypothetical protein BDV98DRAFT_571478, partial [Pterulicium gracile]